MKKSTGSSKYEYLLALNVGEEHVVDNMPTRSEAIRKVSPSSRLAVKRINSALHILKKLRPDYRFTLHVFTSRGSRIEGNKVSIKLISIGDAVSSEQEFDAMEARSKRSLEGWIKRKQAEDAPKLPAQLEEANAGELARRVAGAVKRQINGVELPKYDPKKLAEYVAHFTKGGAIQRLRDDGVWIDDPTPSWTLPTAHYRKKPVVREFYLVVARDGHVTAGASDPLSLPHHDPACRVHVREMLPEEE